MSEISPEVQAFIDRLTRIDPANLQPDKAAVEKAITAHLAVIGLPERPFVWAIDLRTGHRIFTERANPEKDPVWASACWAASVAAEDDPARVGVINLWDTADNAVKGAITAGVRQATDKLFGRMEPNYTALNAQEFVTEAQCFAERGRPVSARWTTILKPLFDAFEAGLFAYWITPEDVICVPPPRSWLANGSLHRTDGPAIVWPSGEQYYFLDGVHVPAWLVEEPHKITVETIRGEQDTRIRRRMEAIYGLERYANESGARLVHKDEFGRLWEDRGWPFFEFVDRHGSTTIRFSQTLLDRLARVDPTAPRNDKAAIEQAIKAHLIAYGIPERPVVWVDDVASGYSLLTGRAAAAMTLRVGASDAALGEDPARNAVLDSFYSHENHQDYYIYMSKGIDEFVFDMAAAAARTSAWNTARDAAFASARVAVERNFLPGEVWEIVSRAVWSAPDEAARGVDYAAHFDLRAFLIVQSPLIEAFESGLFAYWVTPCDVICVPQPKLAIENGRLHRVDGPAVLWSTGEAYHFWHGVQVPAWVIEEPHKITVEAIRSEPNQEIRRCMTEIYDRSRYPQQ